MRLPRTWGLAGTLVLLTVSALPGAAVAGDPAPLSIVYNNAVYGDAVLAGNSVTVCPPVQSCVDAQHRVGLGPDAQNNSYAMRWADIDDDPGTFNSSSGRLVIPPGARIDYATLSWEGAVGGLCAQGGRPPGGPRGQPVSVTVSGRTRTVLPERFTEDDLFYSARAELTGVLRGATGTVPITVGNVWTPQGFDCAGGWSVVAVWAFDGPRAPFAPARKQITVYDTHLRLTAGSFGVSVRVPSLRPAGGGARIGVLAYEGDWAVAGDRFLVNGRDPDQTGNFFASSAEGSLDPSYPNNMSVDVRSMVVPEEAVLPSVELTFSSGLDTYLVAGLVVAVPLPELTAAIDVGRPVAHTGDELSETVRVTNTGGAPIVRVRMRDDLGCERAVDRLDAGRTAVLHCGRAAKPRVSAEVSGESLTGDPLAARADASVEVLDPAIAITAVGRPGIVLKGQPADHEISVRNTGNTPLSAVAVDAQVDACDQTDLGSLAAGESRIVRCSAPADRAANPVTAAGTDKLGLRVTAETTSTVTVVVPRLTLTVTPSTNAVRTGESVTFMINVNNGTAVPLPDVRVTGTPATCARDLGTLAPNQTVSYTCTVVVTDRLTTTLSVTGGPASVTVRASATVIVSVVPQNLPPLQPPSRRATIDETPEPVPIAALIGGLAVVSNLVMVGGFAATACRPK